MQPDLAIPGQSIAGRGRIAALLALSCTLFTDFLELLVKLLDALVNHAAVKLYLPFAFTPLQGSTSLS